MTDPQVLEASVIETVDLTGTVVDTPPALFTGSGPLGIMVDLETLGVGNDALILSIGAVKFNATEIVDGFHVGIDPVSAEFYDRKIDGGTVMWWMQPDRAEARANLLALEKVDMPSALIGFAAWVGPDSLPLWGNGATFDNIILRSSYEACRMEYPVKFYHDRCYRTLKGLVPDIELVREGTHHDALADATSQAKHLLAIVAALGVAL